MESCVFRSYAMSMLKINRLESKNKKLEQQLLLSKLEADDKLNRLNNSWSLRFDMIIGIFEAALKEAGTLGEAKKWYKEWTAQVNACETAEDVADLIERHGFEFTPKPVSTNYKEML